MISKIKNKVLLMILIVSIMMMQTSIVFAESGSSLKIYQHNVQDGKIVLDVSIDNLPQQTTSLQLEIKLSKKIDITDQNLTWVYKNDKSYTTYKMADIDENYKNLIIYLANDAQTVLDQNVKLMTISVPDGSSDLLAGIVASKLKIIDDELTDTTYDNIATSLTVEDKPEEPGGGDSSSGGSQTNKDKDKGNTEVPANPASPSFTDIDGHWAKDSIIKMVEKNIITGYEDGTFKPDNDITRAEFSVLINRMFKLQSEIVELPFKDVALGEWYWDSILNLYANNIIMGKEVDEFGISDNITNEQIAAILVRALESQNIVLEKTRSYTSFDDENSISTYAKNPVSYLYEAGIINGSYNKFNPQSNATRAQAAAMIDRILKLIEK